MARPREFDQQQVLDKALDLFWSKGFEKTSIQDLVQHTGVHRGSLYDTFGDKNQLFAACLERFHALYKDHLFLILKESGEPREILEHFFDELISVAMNNDDQRRGCFITNTSMELGSVDTQISSRIGIYFQDMEARFKDFLQRSQPSGALNDNLSIDEMARFLLSTRQGLLVLGKTSPDRSLLEDASKVAVFAVMKPNK
ncbi:TetR/AcrR family transcriptional regulator [Paenibacillus physcomitrellae]|uniref:TetR family transcriptional regulator n=1 Tax=Paenibacillus physcomitrellae TaxID=1619311 RepID=A0ABQ1GLJ3_9BACL|nr:TetR/AcrR family transcriptional regulator [Paenibacillus physcomitrellae]GGA46212.1 TetR family transcriptional regulator [Paenibacillus physcomitrellae]